MNLRAAPAPRLDLAIQTIYAARRPLTRKRRLSALSDHEAELLDSFEAALDVLEMTEHFRTTRKAE